MQILILGFRQFDFQRFLLFRLSLHKHSSMQMISFLYRQSSRIFTFLRLILTPLILHFYLFYFPLLIPHVLRHIERTKVLVHVVDAASVEGRDPVEDIRTINAELKAYNPSLLERPQVIAANKVDSIYNTGEEDWEDPVERLKREFEPEGIQVFAISAVTGQGVKELLYHVNDLLKTVDRKPVIFEKEFEYQYQGENLPYTVERNEDGIYVVEGPKIEKMLGYTNLDSEKGFQFFQKFLKDSGILAELEEAGIEEGDTVRMYGLEFDYYK